MYAFKRVSKIADQKGVVTYDSNEPPVPFLDSLLLGEVKKISKISPFFFFLLKLPDSYLLESFPMAFVCNASGRIACKEDSFAMMSLPVKRRYICRSFSSLFSLSPTDLLRFLHMQIALISTGLMLYTNSILIFAYIYIGDSWEIWFYCTT